MTRYAAFVLGISLGALLTGTDVHSGPLDAAGHPHQESMKMVHKAKHEVDHAWEVYHRAALGGTVASPQLQAAIEEHLHEARTLITQAQEAAEHGQKDEVERLIKQVRFHTSRAVEGSKEQKK